MRSDDLVPILAPDPGKPVSFRQGTLISWDQSTAENVVMVGNSLLTNLPILNTSEASILTAGDVVGILVSGATWGILGRFTIPGTPEAVTAIKAITNRIVAANDPTNGTRNSTSWGDLTGVDPGPSVTARVGSSGRVLALWSCELGQATDGGGVLTMQTKTTPHVGIELSGANTVAPDSFNALNANLEFPASPATGNALAEFWFQSAMVHLYTDLNPGDTTFTLKYKHDGMTPSNNLNFNAREIAVFVL